MSLLDCPGCWWTVTWNYRLLVTCGAFLVPVAGFGVGSVRIMLGCPWARFRYNQIGNGLEAQIADTTVELNSALRKTKYHFVTSQLLVSSALFLALKFIH